MKITFILPAIGKKPGQTYLRSWLMEPLTIAVLNSMIPERFEREFFDDRIETINYDTETDIVFITVETYTAKRAYYIASEFRKRGKKVIMGGYHVTLCPEEAILYADSIMVGNADRIISGVLSDIENGTLQPRYDGGTCIMYKMPDRSIYADKMKKYLPVSLVETGRGCYHNCEFCSIAGYYHQCYIHREVADIIAEIKSCKHKIFFFVDDSIFSNKAFAKELFLELKKLNIIWTTQITLDIARDDEMLHLMKESGCEMVGFGARFIRDLQRDDIDFYFCSVVAENTDARRMFEKSRRLLEMKQTVGYKTYILSPKVKVNAKKHSFTFRRATESDTDRLIEFLNAEGKKKDMFPVVKSFDAFYNLRAEDFYLLLDGENIIATTALWNQTEYKQYVVKRYGKIMKLARVFNPLLSAFRYIKLPKENAPLNFPMLAFFLCKNDNTDNYLIFLDEIKREVSKKYGMFVFGLPDGHLARPYADKFPSISFETKLYEITFPWSEQTYKTPDPKKLFFECGLL